MDIDPLRWEMRKNIDSIHCTNLVNTIFQHRNLHWRKIGGEEMLEGQLSETKKPCLVCSLQYSIHSQSPKLNKKTNEIKKIVCEKNQDRDDI